MSTPKLATIESLLVSELETEEGYNVRSASELKANAKDIAATMERLGNDPTNPFFRVRYVERDGKKYTRSHATLEAARMQGWKRVNAERVDFDYASDQIDLIVSNDRAHPLSRKQQGEVFKRLRDGVLEPEQDAIDRAKVGEEVERKYVQEPMKMADIAALSGYTQQHISDCIAILEAPEEIGTMIDDGRLSGNVFLMAEKLVNKHHDGKKGKLMEVIRAAVKQAEGERATPKHFEAIKEQFIPLKAATNGNENPAPETRKTSTQPPVEAAETGSGNGSAVPDETRADPAPTPDMFAGSSSETPAANSDEMTEDEERLFSGTVPKKHSKNFERMCKLIDRWGVLFGESFSDDERNRLASAIVLSPDTPF